MATLIQKYTLIHTKQINLKLSQKVCNIKIAAIKIQIGFHMFIYANVQNEHKRK